MNDNDVEAAVKFIEEEDSGDGRLAIRVVMS